MRRRLFAFVICITVSLNLLWAFPAWGAADYSTIRVALSSLGTPGSVSFIVHGAYVVEGKDISLAPGGEYTLARREDKIYLVSGTQEWALGNSCMFARQDASYDTCLEVCNTAYGWRRYLGNMEVRLAGDGLRLINHIYLEQYLYGVVPYEMSNAWPLEALKTQAVAARTYAVRCKNPGGEYDLGDTVSNQIYKGYDPGKTRCIQAVDETAGQVVAWQDAFAGTYYNSSNGGWIESTYNRWGGALPYSTVKEDPYDARSQQNPHRAWSVSYNRLTVDPGLEERLIPCMQEALHTRGYSDAAADMDILQIKSMEPDAPDESGRHSKVLLSLMVKARKRHDGAEETVEQPVELSAGSILSVLDIKSLLFSLQVTDEQCILTGAGNGHGIGMSQYGARQMADEGISCAGILAFYYPGTAVTTLNLNPPVQPEDADGTVSPEASPPPASDDGDTAAEEDMYATVGVSTSLNLRQGPGLQYQKIGSLSDGTRVRVLLQQGDWWQIQAGGLTGYAYGEYIRPEIPAQQSPTPEPVEQEQPPQEDPIPPPDENRRRGEVTASALHVRSGPSTRNHQMGLYVRGDKVDIVGREGNWYRIAFRDTYGYVYSQYIRILGAGEDEGMGESGMIIATWLNVRTGPGVQYDRIAQLREGTQVEIIATEGHWHQIRFDGGTGYVYAGYVGPAADTQRGEERESMEGTINAPRVNIRSGPSLQSMRIGSLSQGDSLEIRGAENGWYLFEYQGAQAYVHASLVTVAGHTARVTPSTLNIRSGPGTQYPVAGQLRQDNTVVVLSEKGDWTNIMQGEGSGYVYSAYLASGQ